MDGSQRGEQHCCCQLSPERSLHDQERNDREEDNLMHSRARVNIRHEAKARGNHTGYGKRHGTMNARIPEKLLWMRRIRVLRRLLRKYRDAGKIDKHMYAHFYALAKGNRYKTKRSVC